MLLWIKTNAAPVKPMLTPFQRLVLSSIDAIALGLVSSCLLMVQRAESVNLSPKTGRVDLAVLRVPLSPQGSKYESGRLYLLQNLVASSMQSGLSVSTGRSGSFTGYLCIMLDLSGTTLRVNEIDSYTKIVTTCYLLFELHQDQMCILLQEFGLTHALIAFRPTHSCSFQYHEAETKSLIHTG